MGRRRIKSERDNEIFAAGVRAGKRTKQDQIRAQAERDTTLRIAGELYNEAMEYERQKLGAEERSGDKFDSVALMYYHMKNAILIYTNRLVLSLVTTHEAEITDAARAAARKYLEGR